MESSGNGQTAAQKVDFLLIDIVGAAFRDNTTGTDIVEVVQVLGRIVAYLVKIDFHEGFDRLPFQADIVVIGGSDNGIF